MPPPEGAHSGQLRCPCGASVPPIFASDAVFTFTYRPPLYLQCNAGHRWSVKTVTSIDGGDYELGDYLGGPRALSSPATGS